MATQAVYLVAGFRAFSRMLSLPQALSICMGLSGEGATLLQEGPVCSGLCNGLTETVLCCLCSTWPSRRLAVTCQPHP